MIEHSCVIIMCVLCALCFVLCHVCHPNKERVLLLLQQQCRVPTCHLPTSHSSEGVLDSALFWSGSTFGASYSCLGNTRSVKIRGSDPSAADQPSP